MPKSFIVDFIFTLVLAYGCFMCLCVGAQSNSALSVVVSGSMEPALHRGDLILVEGWSTPAIDDVILYKMGTMNTPIVHRVVKIDNGLLTKGDANPVDDRGLYNAAAPGRTRLRPEDVLGTVWLSIPWLGFLTIWSREYWMISIPLITAYMWYSFRSETREKPRMR